MRFGLVEAGGDSCVVVERHEKLYAMEPSVSLLDLISEKKDLLESSVSRSQSGNFYSPEEVTVLPPIPSLATRIFCVGLNFMDHFLEGYAKREGDKQPPRYPTFFYKAPQSAVGNHGSVPLWEHVSRQLDYEAELAVIIGKTGRDISRERSDDHVFGYSVANDLTYRDVQRRHGGQWAKGKTMDNTCALGPYIVTSEEWQPDSHEITCLVNGNVRQQSTLDNMLFSIPAILESLSSGLTLFAGDIILMGTPAGVGYAQEPPSFLSPGDKIETRIQGLGSIYNEIVSAQDLSG